MPVSDACSLGERLPYEWPCAVRRRAIVAAASLVGRARPPRRALREFVFPFRLETARDEPIVRIDGAITALGALRLVARVRDLSAPLEQGLADLDCAHRAPIAAGVTAATTAAAKRRRSAAADAHAVLAPAVDDRGPRAVVARRRVAIAAIHAQATAAAPTRGDALQGGGAFSHGALGLVTTWVRIGADARLVGLESVPVAESADEQSPLGAWPAPRAPAHLSRVVDIAPVSTFPKA